MKKLLVLFAFTLGGLFGTVPAFAADYVIDTKGAHAFVQFRTKHLGISWLYGRFTEFGGEFSWDAKKPDASKVSVKVSTTSLESNHAERDKHLRSSDFLDVSKYPEAKFVSTSFKSVGGDKFVLKGDMTLFSKTKEVSIDVVKVGEGDDPWGGYRVGFEGTTSINPADFGIDMSPMVESVELTLSVEGIRK